MLTVYNSPGDVNNSLFFWLFYSNCWFLHFVKIFVFQVLQHFNLLLCYPGSVSHMRYVRCPSFYVPLLARSLFKMTIHNEFPNWP